MGAKVRFRIKGLVRARYLLLLTFIIYFVYFRWLAFEYSFNGQKLKFDLPDFVSGSYLDKCGFEVAGSDDLYWYKFDKFEWKVNERVFTDSMEIRLYISSGYVGKKLSSPFVERYEILLKSVSDHNFIKMLNIDPIEISKNEYGEISSEKYRLDSSHVLIRIPKEDSLREHHPKYPNDYTRYVIYSTVYEKELTFSWKLYAFLKRLPFLITFPIDNVLAIF